MPSLGWSWSRSCSIDNFIMTNYILQIDTATEVCSVSVSVDGKTIGKLDAVEPNVHASQLTLNIDKLLASLELTYQDLRAVAVSMGPGSYTGLRIGVSTAKGLCYALDIPLLGINTLESIYYGYTQNIDIVANAFYIPMLDARRMEVYMSIYNANSDLLKPTEAIVVDQSTFENLQSDKIILFGSGASKLKDLFEGNETIVIDSEYKHSSSYLSHTAHKKFLNQEFEDLIYFEPYYLKEFIATMPKKIVLG